jgi:curved DNA-binding protein CbpA
MIGNFSQILPADLLGSIHSRRESGTLILRSEGVKKQLSLDKGILALATGTAEADDFGEMLIRIGQLSPSQLDQAKRASKPGSYLSQTLLDMGLFQARDLRQFFELQVQEIVYPVVEWAKGEYEFKGGDINVDSRIRLELRLPPLILEGVRRIKSLEAVYRGLKGNDTEIRLSAQFEDRAAEAGLDSEEAFVLSRVDACSKISEILQISPLGLEKTQKILYALVATGIVELASSPAKTPAAPRTNVSQAFRTFHSEPVVAEPVSQKPHREAESQRELEALKLEVFSMLDSLRTKTFYELLNVPSNASLDEIKKSYYTLAKQFHPDRYAQFTEPDIKGALETIFSTLAQAYDILKVPATRASYDAKAFKPEPQGVSSPEKPVAGPQSETSPMGQQRLAELNYRQGRGYYDQQDYWSAIQALRQSVRLGPEVARFRYWLAMALSKNPKWRREAEEHFLKAIELEQFVPAYYVGLGMLYKEVGMTKRAETQFRRALEVSPGEKSATEALQDLVTSKKKESKGLKSLVGLFKKK